MEKFKNWKSELKKKGAMALTAFMLCGSAGTAFAQETPDIYINDESSGTLGNTQSVTGYQTDKETGYAANIAWGDMLFVYDRGTYDPISGTLVGSFQDETSDYHKKGIEIDGDKSKAGYWYGFDGENNAVTIENLSTEAVKLTATSSVTGSNANDVKFSLYVENSNDAWSGLGLIESSKVGHDPLDGDSASDPRVWAKEDENGRVSRVFNAREFNDNGGIATTDSDVIYLNITGKPNDEFMDRTGYESNDQKGEELGTITLNFTMADGDELDEVSGD